MNFQLFACRFVATTTVLVSISNNKATLAVPVGNKSIPLVLSYIYSDNTRENVTFAGGLLPLRDIIVDIVNKNQSILPHYHVTINELRSLVVSEDSMGLVIQMFFAKVVKTCGECTCLQQQQQQRSWLLAHRNSSTRNETDSMVAFTDNDKFTRAPAPLYFGPERSAEARVIAQLAPKFNLIGISSQTAAADLSDRTKYPNFYRTAPNAQMYIKLPRALLNYLNYTTVGLLHLDGFLGADLMQAVEEDLRLHHFQVTFKEIFFPRRNESMRDFAKNAQIFDTRVFVFQSNTGYEYKMFCHAINTIGADVFTAENYFFIHLMLIDSDTVLVPKSIALPNCTQEMLDRLVNTSLVAWSPTWDDSPGPIDIGLTVPELREQILNLSRSDKYGNSRVKPSDMYALCAFTADMFWTGLLALDKLDQRLRAETPNPRSLLDFTFQSADIARMLKEEVGKVRFCGARGLVSINADGGLTYNITITQYIVGKGHIKRFVFDPDSSQLTPISPPTFATSNGLPPPDKKPLQMADTASAQQQMLAIVLSAVAAVVAAVGGACLAVYVYHRRALARSLAHPSWLYDQRQLKMRELAQSVSSLAGGSIATSGATIALEEDLPAYPTALLISSGDLIVRLQSIPPAAPRLQVNKANHKIITAFHDALVHVNVVRFVGCSIFGQKFRKPNGGALVQEQYLIWEHCEKGSLQELIDNHAFKLDTTFEYALLLDVAEGMAFLHHNKSASVIGPAHGRLNPDVCLIDRRFSVKVGAYGDKALAGMFGLESLEDCDLGQEKQLYWAPELLRQNTNHPTCSHASDVYAYGMTTYALLTRLPPFEADLEFDAMMATDILEQIRDHNPKEEVPMRPNIPEALKTQRDLRLWELVQRCWAEQPSARPAFSEIVQTLRTVSNVKGRSHNSVTDQLLNRLERYASDMESLVAERTVELRNEKRRSDDLLNRMLPPDIVVELKEHGYVHPEAFDSVTIYFSDIVGFTAISSTSTPIEIVSLLNSLYTMFDAQIDLFDTYKVETIGDAYMVVSGLPRRNGDQHAAEIARLSLALLAGIHVFVIPHRPHEKLMLRIGLHTGPCVAGVVGIKMPRYCLFGDTVNTASRMESHGAPLMVHISDSTKLALDKLGGFRTELRGELEIKGKGIMATHWLMEEQR